MPIGSRKTVKRSRRATRRRVPGKAMVSMPVKQEIARAVRRVTPETKFVSLWNGATTSAQVFGIDFNGGIGTGTNYSLIPPIPQGWNVGERIGNKIAPTRLVVDFWVTATNYVSSCDMVARLFILESLNVRDPTQINTIDMDTLLDWGQTQGPFAGFTSSLSGRVNRDEFKVRYDKLLKIDKTAGQGPAVTNGYSGNVPSSTTNMIHHFRVSLKCPPVLHYPVGGSSLPDGWAPFFNAGYCLPSATTADGPDVTASRLRISYTSTLFYKDA